MTRWSSHLADPQTISLGIYTTLWDSNWVSVPIKVAGELVDV